MERDLCRTQWQKTSWQHLERWSPCIHHERIQKQSSFQQVLCHSQQCFFIYLHKGSGSLMIWWQSPSKHASKSSWSYMKTWERLWDQHWREGEKSSFPMHSLLNIKKCLPRSKNDTPRFWWKTFSTSFRSVIPWTQLLTKCTRMRLQTIWMGGSKPREWLSPQETLQKTCWAMTTIQANSHPFKSDGYEILWCSCKHHNLNYPDYCKPTGSSMNCTQDQAAWDCSLETSKMTIIDSDIIASDPIAAVVIVMITEIATAS